MRSLAFLFSLVASVANAGGWSNEAVPTRVDIERDSGFMIYGAFGNGGSCVVPDQIYVQRAHPQYKEIYATVLAAFMSGKKVQAYIHECKSVGWYAVPETTFNNLTPSGALNIMAP